MGLSKAISSYFDQLIYAIGNYHYNWHPAIELLLVIQGQVIVNVDGHQYQLAPADMILINANQGHATLAAHPNTLAIRTHIQPTFFQEQGIQLNTGKFNLNGALNRHHHSYPALRQAVAQLYFAKNPFEKNSACFRLTSLLYENFFTPTDRAQAPKQRNVYFAQVAKDIQRDYQRPLSLDMLAKKYGYSKPYFSKLFKQHFGIGFYEFLTRERLQHASSELNQRHEKISTVALNNGFTEVKSFNLAFKKHFGITPSAYQEKYSPQVTAVDAHFQQEISHQQLACARQCLKNFCYPQNAARLLENDCQNCVYKKDGLRYRLLKKELVKLLDDKN